MDSTWGSGSGTYPAGAWQPGATVGDYVLTEKLGQGGMGVVWQVRHHVTQDVFAMKTLSLEADPLLIARFQREAQAQAMTDSHANVCRVHAIGEHRGQLYMIMELAPGGDLKQRLRAGPLPPREAAGLVGQLARGLAHVHARGILHRDLKPANVLFNAEGVPMLVDFGVARLQTEQRLTQSGSVLGTPAYMAPEQLDGRREAVDERSDVYGLGAVLYEALTAEPPYTGQVTAVVKAALTEPPPPPSRKNPDVPADVERVCLKAMAREPAERHPNARAFAEDLERLARGERLGGTGARSRAPLVVALGVVLLGVAAAAGLLLTRPASQASPPGTPAAPKPSLSVRAPPAPWRSPQGTLAGEARGAQTVEYQVGRLGTPAQVPVQDGRFQVALTLDADPGEYRVLLTPISAAGVRGDPLTVAVPLQPPPAWYRALPADARPALPFPAGIDFGASEGEYVNQRDGSILVYVPAGSFPMGAPEREVRELFKDNTYRVLPRHQVTLSRPFFLGKYEVTRAQYRAFCAATGHAPPGPFRAQADYEPQDRDPVVDVSWYDAQDYLAWAGLRLPSEAEWEYAAAGPQGTKFPWGSGVQVDLSAETTPTSQVLPLNATQSLGTHEIEGEHFAYLAPVGSFPAGASWVGALDMAGNACEWVQDAYTPYAAQAQQDPLADPGPDARVMRVQRGGSWDDGMQWCNSWMREDDDPRQQKDVIGFRVALYADR